MVIEDGEILYYEDDNDYEYDDEYDDENQWV